MFGDGDFVSSPLITSFPPIFGEREFVSTPSVTSPRFRRARCCLDTKRSRPLFSACLLLSLLVPPLAAFLLVAIAFSAVVGSFPACCYRPSAPKRDVPSTMVRLVHPLGLGSTPKPIVPQQFSAGRTPHHSTSGPPRPGLGTTPTQKLDAPPTSSARRTLHHSASGPPVRAGSDPPASQRFF